MVFYQLSEKARLRRQRTNEAIALAMQSRWEEAVAVNQSIIDVFPDDADAYNRLGKALTQLGKYDEATGAYQRALELEPHNSIAKKNLERLAYLKEAGTEPKVVKQVSSHLFIEETGKAAVADLNNLADQEVLAKMAAGDPVSLESGGQSLMVVSVDGDYIGEVDPKLGLRLVKLIEGGNRYSAAIASIATDAVRVMIKEDYQHPSQAGRPSFPARAADDFRAYVKDSMLKYEREEEEEGFEEEYTGGPEKEGASHDDITYHEEVVSLEGEADEEDDADLEEQ
ncbi:MAG TPA: tetratricopeptide repeat protein [Dehalococcoidia bacterium]|nr:tetratricopeptide repeat protein [Dehalococcoidia bacterium]